MWADVFECSWLHVSVGCMQHERTITSVDSHVHINCYGFLKKETLINVLLEM